MAFFKFRNKSDAPAAAPVQPESIERLRQRAKYRLVGATLLVLLGVVGFPLLFDQQPRPIAVDTPIQIPDKNKVQPLALPAPAVAASDVAVAQPASAPAVLAAAPTTPASAVITETAEAPKPLQNATKNAPSEPVQKASVATKSIAVSEAKIPVKPAAAAVVNSAPKPETADKALALLEAQSLPKPVSPASADAGAARFVVQVGAFADTVRAKDVRRKLEAAGLKTYTNVAQTKDGERTRVRVGPFAERPEADKAAEKIKKLKLPAVVLTL